MNNHRIEIKNAEVQIFDRNCARFPFGANTDLRKQWHWLQRFMGFTGGGAQGIGRQALAVLSATTYDAGIIKKDRAQNVFSQSFLEFQARMITDYRIKHGAELVQKHKATFAQVENSLVFQLR
jgi:membrane-bound lytic murein transglycosylase B